MLWRPVLDVHGTFVRPETPWGQEHFAPDRLERLERDGFLPLNGTFQLGSVLYEELRYLDPVRSFLAAGVPTLIVHGDEDVIVSFDAAHRTAAARPQTTLHTITAADHGFSLEVHEREAIDVSVSWVKGRR